MGTVNATLDFLVLDKTNDLSASATFDLWIGKPEAKATFDTFVKARDQSVSATLDMHISRRAHATFDFYVSEARGTYRGIMSVLERDALEALVPNDTVHTVRAEQPTQTEMWTGDKWISADQVTAPEAGQKRSFVAPTLEGFFAEVGDPAEPFRYSDGFNDRFVVRDDGSVHATEFQFGVGSTLDQADSITLKETAPYATPARIQENHGTALASTSKSQAWGTPTGAGHLLVFIVHCNSSTATVTTPPSGYTLGPTSISSGYATRVYYKANSSAGAATPSITFSAAVDIAVITREYSGIATSSPLDITASKAGVSSVSTGGAFYIDTAFTPTTVPVTLLLGVIGRTGAQDDSNNPGWDTIANPFANNAGLIAADTIALSQIDFQFNSTGGESLQCRGVLAAFKAAPIGIPTPDANTLVIYAEDVAGKAKLRWESDAAKTYLLDAGARTDGYSLAAAPAVANTTVQTPVFSWTLPANEAKVGDIITVDLWGTTNNKASSGTLLFELTMAHISGSSHTIASEASAHTNKPWKIHIVFQVVEIGSTGLIWAMAEWTSYMAAATTTAVRDDMWTQILSPDTTIDEEMVHLEIKWASANINNGFYLNGATVHVARRAS